MRDEEPGKVMDSMVTWTKQDLRSYLVWLRPPWWGRSMERPAQSSGWELCVAEANRDILEQNPAVLLGVQAGCMS